MGKQLILDLLQNLKHLVFSAQKLEQLKSQIA